MTKAPRVSFLVERHKPVAQGNLRGNRQGKLYYQSSTELKDYKEAVAFTGLAAARRVSWDKTGPKGLSIVFGFTRPPSTKREWPEVRPDVDKLLRGVGDALSGVLWDDDAQVVQAIATKRYSLPEEVRHAPFTWVLVHSIEGVTSDPIAM